MSKSKKIFKVIPETTSIYHGLKLSELRKVVLEYYNKNLKDREVFNEDLKITIRFSMSSGRKTVMGEAMYYKKAEIMKILPEIVQYALYNNYGERKETDNPSVIGYLNFKGKCKLDGKIENIRLAVQFQKTAKFYYNVEVNKIK